MRRHFSYIAHWSYAGIERLQSGEPLFCCARAEDAG
jgi:hypothetical protein